MKEKQIDQFNKMLNTLKIIAKYRSPEWLRKNCEKEYGLEYEEALEMAYENVLNSASFGHKGVKAINPTHPPK